METLPEKYLKIDRKSSIVNRKFDGSSTGVQREVRREVNGSSSGSHRKFAGKQRSVTACQQFQKLNCRYTQLIRLCFPHCGIASLAQVSTMGLCPLLGLKLRGKTRQRGIESTIFEKAAACFSHRGCNLQKLSSTCVHFHPVSRCVHTHAPRRGLVLTMLSHGFICRTLRMTQGRG